MDKHKKELIEIVKAKIENGRDFIEPIVREDEKETRYYKYEDKQLFVYVQSKAEKQRCGSTRINLSKLSKKDLEFYSEEELLEIWAICK